MKTRHIRVFDSHAAADADDGAYYSSLTPQQRLDLVLELSAGCQEDENAAREGCSRVVELDLLDVVEIEQLVASD